VKLVEDLIESAGGGEVPILRAAVGLHWTAVESRTAGMSHTYKTHRKVELSGSGSLEGLGALETSSRLRDWEPLEASLGLASLNSLIEPRGEPGSVNGAILEAIPGRSVAVIGRFPFNGRVASGAGEAFFFETEPTGDELPPFAVEEVLPRVDVAVITATALINKSLPRLLELSRDAWSVVLGPSTPMNDVLLDHGADLLGGIRVVRPDALFSSVMQGVKKFGKIGGIEPIMLGRRFTR